MTVSHPRPTRSQRADYARFFAITTRWHDNDVFGHVNNVVYYAFFDTAVNRMLIEAGLLDPAHSEVVGLVAETRCTFFEAIAFPAAIEVGVRVEHVGRSSVRYGLGIFTADGDAAVAQGEFTHVYVDRGSRRPIDMPVSVRALLTELQASIRQR